MTRRPGEINSEGTAAESFFELHLDFFALVDLYPDFLTDPAVESLPPDVGLMFIEAALYLMRHHGTLDAVIPRAALDGSRSDQQLPTDEPEPLAAAALLVAAGLWAEVSGGWIFQPRGLVR